MVAKTMDQKEFCHGCTNKSGCQEVYEKIGNIQGGSIVSKVMTAFLLPILVFIACLACFDKLLAKVTTSKELQTAAGLLLALLVTCVCVLVIIVINRSLIKHK
jgi:hypothetical protein